MASVSSNKEKLKDFKYPILIFHGTSNPAMPFEDIRQIVRGIGSYEQTFKRIENGYIELYCDTEKEGLILETTLWIQRKAKTAPTLGNLSHYELRTKPKTRKFVNFKNLCLLLGYLLAIKM